MPSYEECHSVRIFFESRLTFQSKKDSCGMTFFFMRNEAMTKVFKISFDTATSFYIFKTMTN